MEREMKTLLIFTVAFMLTIYGCSMSKPLTSVQNEIVYEHNVDLTKDELRKKLILFANEKFISGKAVIQTDDDGLLAGNGISQLPISIPIIRMEFTFIVKYTDNNYRVKWIVKDLMTDLGRIVKRNWGYYYDDIELVIKNNDEELFKYLSSTESNF